MDIIKTDIDGLVVIRPDLYTDNRGCFMESFNHKEFCEKIARIDFVQDNESVSCYGVIRGLHFQQPPYAQSKLIRVLRGTILDVALDIRSGSPFFGRTFSIELSDQNRNQLFIPRGFAHGFSVLSDFATVLYKTDNYYAPEAERAISCSDSTLNINWGIPTDKIILSEKDSLNPAFADLEHCFDYEQYKCDLQ